MVIFIYQLKIAKLCTDFNNFAEILNVETKEIIKQEHKENTLCDLVNGVHPS